MGKRAQARRSRTSSGFRPGITGQALTGRAFAQAQKFGAQVMVASGAQKLDAEPQALRHREQQRARPCRRARSSIASGAAYRKPPIANLSHFEGAGVYYAATFMESPSSAATRK